MWDVNHKFADFNRFFVGFDTIIEKATKFVDDSIKLATSYPPYNIRKEGDNTYVIEMAVAGFSRQDLEITLEDDVLVIKGNSSSDETEDTIYKGIANRAFTRSFKLADKVEVKNAGLVNGMLRIAFDSVIPESSKVKIEIEEKDE